MPKYPEPYIHPQKKHKTYYFKYTDPKTGIRKTKATPFIRGEKEQARNFVRNFMDDIYASKDIRTFREYAEPFFIWDQCPRTNRLLKEGKSIGKYHVKNSRSWLKNYVFQDPFSRLDITSIRRGDILDLRDRIEQLTGLNTVNKVITTVKTILSEAFYRGDIPIDPVAKIGKIKYEVDRPGILFPGEIKILFSDFPGAWLDHDKYIFFLIAAHTGMRRGENVALKWDAVDLRKKTINVIRAFKTNKELGPPKWNKTRVIPITDRLTEAITSYYEDSVRIAPDDFLFCDKNGKAKGETWVRKNFIRVLEHHELVAEVSKDQEQKRYINRRGEKISFHSLRHSLNTNLLAEHCNPLFVQQYLGWSPDVRSSVLTTVQKGYTHLEDDSLRDVVRIIEEMY